MQLFQNNTTPYIRGLIRELGEIFHLKTDAKHKTIHTSEATTNNGLIATYLWLAF